MSDRSRGTAYGLAAAALFGLSAPVSKLLLPGLGVLSLAAILYLGAGIAITGVRVGRRVVKAAATDGREAKLQLRDAPALLGVVVLGGGLAPVLMLIGLQRTSGIAGALLLNLEAP